MTCPEPACVAPVPRTGSARRFLPQSSKASRPCGLLSVCRPHSHGFAIGSFPLLARLLRQIKNVPFVFRGSLHVLLACHLQIQLMSPGREAFCPKTKGPH